MKGLSVRGLSKWYGKVPAITDVSFEVGPTEFVSLLGPSGCGKTTTLRSIAGFETPSSGTIVVNGEAVVDVESGHITPPNKRNFGMVFQSYAVWPHMTVLQNVAYPLRVGKKYAGKEVTARAMEALRVVGMTGLDKRYPGQLSGGQQQRVALARALAMEPRVLLFDEPLSNLDSKLRERMRFELVEIQSKLGIPALYVTHDQAEAMVMSTRVVVMDRGQIVQQDEPRVIYEAPSDKFVAEFVGIGNFINGVTASRNDDGTWQVASDIGTLRCSMAKELAPAERVLLLIRPERIDIDPAPDVENVFQAVVEHRYFMGSFSEYLVRVGDVQMRLQSVTSSFDRSDRIRIGIKAEHCRAITRGTPAE